MGATKTKAEKEAEKAAKAAAAEAKKAADAAAKAALGGVPKNVKEVQVVDKNGDVIRTYSEKVHGGDFLKHAGEFASKEEGRKVEEVD